MLHHYWIIAFFEYLNKSDPCHLGGVQDFAHMICV
jgi:hypothetical protein